MENKEIWKSIKGYEGDYEVSNLGRVKSVDRIKLVKDPKSNREYYRHFPESIKTTSHDPKGYVIVSLKSSGKHSRHRMHRLVAEAFIPNPGNLPQVNHKDENKDNNSVDNLEWCTNEYNGKYGTRIQRISEKRRGKSTHNAIRVIIDNVYYPSLTKAGEALGVCENTIKRRIEQNKPGYKFYDKKD